MSRGRRPTGSRGRSGRRSASERPARGRAWLVALLLIALAGFVVWRVRPPGLGRTRAGASDRERVMLDSLKAADQRRDWVAALRWAELLGETRGNDHTVLLARGIAWTNYAMEQRPGRVFPRPPLRTSLERMACQRRAIGLMDSSSRVAPDAQRWIDSGQRLADLYDALALPGDALITYEIIKQRQPDALAPAMRAYFLRAMFYDPVHPDTSEYHEQMKRMGLR
jgi:hypothetical protein